MKKIRATGIYKHFDKLAALSDISLEIKPGDCVGIVGPNGSGKTTLLKILSGVMSTSEGSVNLYQNETDFHAVENSKKYIGMIPQEECLDVTLNVIENLVYFARYSGMSKKDAWEKAHASLDKTPVKAKKVDEINGLSTGTRKKIAILRCMMTSPDFIFMDEPANHLDIQSKDWLYNLIKSHPDKGIAISSHDIHDIDYLCNYILILKEGKVLAHGRPEDLITKHIPKYALEFILHPEIETLSDYSDIKKTHTHFFKENVCVVYSDNKEELKNFSDKFTSSSVTLRDSTFSDLYSNLLTKHEAVKHV